MNFETHKGSGKGLGNFDEFARNYRQVHNEHLSFSGADSDFFSEQKIKVIRSLEAGPIRSILDLGCGDGNSAQFFARHFSDSRYTGVDTSAVSIELADGRGINGARFLHYDGKRLPFQDGSFDMVFVACVFHHIEPDAHGEVLTEIKRVLNNGGIFYLFEHNPINPITRRIVRNCPFDEDAILLRSGYTRQMLDLAGFRHIEVGYTLFFPNHKVFRGLHALEPYLRWLPVGGQYYARALKD